MSKLRSVFVIFARGALVKSVPCLPRYASLLLKFRDLAWLESDNSQGCSCLGDPNVAGFV